MTSNVLLKRCQSKMSVKAGAGTHQANVVHDNWSSPRPASALDAIVNPDRVSYTDIAVNGTDKSKQRQDTVRKGMIAVAGAFA